MQQDSIEQIFSLFSAQNPSPKTELYYLNHYTLLVAIVLSAQATDKGVNKATKILFPETHTPEAMVKLGEEGLKHYIKTIGLYNAKAKNIIALSRILIERYHSQVPKSFAELHSLPGVGTKTANVMLNCAFGQATIAVDTHVLRVSNRIGLIHEKHPDQAGEKLLKIVPKKWQLHAHHWLILHGRYVCKARKPLCQTCVIAHLCQFPEKRT